jgi:hypothetical protein
MTLRRQVHARVQVRVGRPADHRLQPAQSHPADVQREHSATTFVAMNNGDTFDVGSCVKRTLSSSMAIQTPDDDGARYYSNTAAQPPRLAVVCG